MSTSKDKIQLILKVEERILLDFESWEAKLTQVIMRDLDFENWMPKLKIKKIGEKLRQQKTYRVQNCSLAFFSFCPVLIWCQLPMHHLKMKTIKRCSA